MARHRSRVNAGPELAVDDSSPDDEQGHVVEAEFVEQPIVEHVVLARAARAERRRHARRAAPRPVGAGCALARNSRTPPSTSSAGMHSLPDATLRASCVDRARRHGQVLDVHALLARGGRQRRGPPDRPSTARRASRADRAGRSARRCACRRRRRARSSCRRRSAGPDGAPAPGGACRRKLSTMSRKASMRVSRPASAVCESISRTRYGLLAHHPAQVVQHERVGRAGEVRDPGQVEVRRSPCTRSTAFMSCWP